MKPALAPRKLPIPRLSLTELGSQTFLIEGKLIVCERHTADKSFLFRYNERMKRICESPEFDSESGLTIFDPESGPTIFISKWYRNKLNIELGVPAMLGIKPETENKKNRDKASQDHPLAVVRSAVDLGRKSVTLGRIGLFLGIVGLLLGIASLCLSL